MKIEERQIAFMRKHRIPEGLRRYNKARQNPPIIFIQWFACWCGYTTDNEFNAEAHSNNKGHGIYADAISEPREFLA